MSLRCLLGIEPEERTYIRGREEVQDDLGGEQQCDVQEQEQAGDFGEEDQAEPFSVHHINRLH